MRSVFAGAMALSLLTACGNPSGTVAQSGSEGGDMPAAGQRAPDKPLIDENALRARAAVVAQARKQLADPDPSVQLAAIEAAVATGDPTLRQLALQVGFASADQGLRAAALSYYFAAKPTVTINISTAPEYAAAVSAWKEARARGQDVEFSQGWSNYANNVDALSQVTIVVRSFDATTGVFAFNVADGLYQERINQERFLTGSVAGETVNITGRMRGQNGDLTFQANLSLEEGGVLKGNASVRESFMSRDDFSASPAEARVF